jgi:hypothetical protein
LVQRVRHHVRSIDLDQHDPLRAEIRGDHDRRRTLLRTILEETDLTRDECVDLVSGSLLVEDDGAWLLDAVLGAPSQRQPVWARCLYFVVRGSSPRDLIDALLERGPACPALAIEFSWLLEPFGLELIIASRSNHNTLLLSIPLPPSARGAYFWT